MNTTVIQIENGAVFWKVKSFVFIITSKKDNFLTFSCNQNVQKSEKKNTTQKTQTRKFVS